MSYLAANGRCERGRWIVPGREDGIERDVGRCIDAAECDCPHGGDGAASDPAPSVIVQPCERCGGEGQLYTSRHGGNDPDVWPNGECPVCDGTGRALLEAEPADELER